jgi:hypothetical protein
VATRTPPTHRGQSARLDGGCGYADLQRVRIPPAAGRGCTILHASAPIQHRESSCADFDNDRPGDVTKPVARGDTAAGLACQQARWSSRRPRC